MKTKLMITISSILMAVSLMASPRFGGQVGAGFESEYTSRGIVKGENALVTNAGVSVNDAYVGVTGFVNAAQKKIYDNEVDFNAGYKFDHALYGFTVDVGTIVYYYPQARTNKGETDYSIEPYVGLQYSDVIGAPAAYVYYDPILNTTTVEGTLTEKFTTQNSIPLLGKLSLIPKAYAGYSVARDALPRQLGKRVKDEYTYYGASVDLGVTVHGIEFLVGPRYVTTNGEKVNPEEISWGTSATYRF